MTNYYQEAMEMSLVDTHLSAEHFKFFFDRNLTLDQIDGENKVVKLEARVDGLKKYVKTLSDAMQEQIHDYGSASPQTYESYNSAVDTLMKVEGQLKDTIYSTDQCIANRENGTSQFMEAEIDKKKTTGQEIIDFLHLYINKVTLTDLVTIYNTACEMHQDKEISWYEYLVIGIATTQKLAINTKKIAGWWDECNRLKANKAKFQPRREIPGLETRFYGEMNMDMEGAIDYMRHLRQVAEDSNCTPFEIAAQNEQKQFSWESEMVYSAYDINEDVDVAV